MSEAPQTAVPPAPTWAPLFVSHGSPMLTLDAGPVGQTWQAMAATMPRPHAILAVSAHWTTSTPAVSAAPWPQTIHDFYGFPDALYDIQYQAPGAVELARDIKAVIPHVGVDAERGLDHGAWVPLREMFPAADIPVAQFAVMPGQSPEMHYRLGECLRPLADAGVLILASGSVTHNLRDLVGNAPPDAALPYVAEFRDWLVDALTRHDLEALFDYRHRAPHAVRAHPTDEHLLPLFVALGAAGAKATTEVTHRGYDLGALAMDAYRFTPARAAACDPAAPASRE